MLANKQKRQAVAYFLFVVIMFVSNLAGGVLNSLVGPWFTPYGVIGRILLFALIVYPGYWLLKRSDDWEGPD